MFGFHIIVFVEHLPFDTETDVPVPYEKDTHYKVWGVRSYEIY